MFANFLRPITPQTLESTLYPQLVSITSVSTTLEVSKTGLHKKRRNPKFILFWQTYQWQSRTGSSSPSQDTHWLHSGFTTLTGKNIARQIFHKILQTGCFCMHQFYMCILPWIWSTSVCTRHIYTCMKEKVIFWKRGLPRNWEKSKQV